MKQKKQPVWIYYARCTDKKGKTKEGYFGFPFDITVASLKGNIINNGYKAVFVKRVDEKQAIKIVKGDKKFKRNEFSIRYILYLKEEIK